jgi:hypothetical protein
MRQEPRNQEVTNFSMEFTFRDYRSVPRPQVRASADPRRDEALVDPVEQAEASFWLGIRVKQCAAKGNAIDFSQQLVIVLAEIEQFVTKRF